MVRARAFNNLGTGVMEHGARKGTGRRHMLFAKFCLLACRHVGDEQHDWMEFKVTRLAYFNLNYVGGPREGHNVTDVF